MRNYPYKVTEQYPIKFRRSVDFLICVTSGRSSEPSFLRYNFMLSCSFFNFIQMLIEKHLFTLNVYTVKKSKCLLYPKFLKM